MNNKVEKVLNEYRVYKENSVRNTAQSEYLYKYLNDPTLNDLDISKVEEYLVRMEQTSDKQERNKIMNEELGGVLYVYAIQNEDYDLLDELIVNKVDLKYAINEKVHKDRPKVNDGVYKSLIYVVAETYILLQEYNIHDQDRKHYEFSGPLCNNLDGDKLIELLKMLMMKYMEVKQPKIKDTRILLLWSPDEDESFGHEMKLQHELMYSILKDYINYKNYATETTARRVLNQQLPKEVLNHVMFPKNGKGKGKKSNKKKSKKSKKTKKKNKYVT